MHPLTDADLLLWHRRAVTMARNMGAPAAEWEDMAQEGMLGLLRAQRRFDPSRGAQFCTFAYPHVRGAILDAARRDCSRCEVGSIDATLPEDETLTFADVIPAAPLDPDAALDCSAALATLPGRERFALVALVVRGWRGREVAAVLGCSASRVSQIKTKALARMRRPVA